MAGPAAVLATKNGVAAAGGGGAAAGGGAAGGAAYSSGSGAGSVGSSVLSGVSGGMTIKPVWQSIMEIWGAKQNRNNLDRQFEEDLRRYNQEFALNNFATRKGISLQEAQMIYEQSMGAAQARTNAAQLNLDNTVGMAAARSARQQDALNLRTGQFNLAEAQKSSTNRSNLANAFSKGLAQGFRLQQPGSVV